jgi:putative spermidine/putrescine transport system ATP-binding protein
MSPFLELQQVRKVFASGAYAVESFNLQVERAEFVSFLGPSGCGKTTTLRMIAGFETPSSGTIRIDGQDVTGIPANRRQIGMVFQSYALFPNLTVAANIGFGMRVASAPRHEIEARVRELLALIHLQEFGNRYPHQLSGGQQQRVALARALATRPRVLLLDEPLSALDAKIRQSLRQEIRAIQRQFGITTIYVTHDQEEALSLSDRVVVMNAGRIEQVGTPLQIYHQPSTPFVGSFVGALNVVVCRVLDPASGRLEFAGQPIETGASLAERTNGSGDTVSIALRPERLTVTRGEHADIGLNALRGTVDDVSFLGSVVRLRVRCAEQLIQVDALSDPEHVPARAGDDVSVVFPPEACLLLEATPSLLE